MAVASRLASPINIKGVSKSVSTAKKSLNQTTNSFKKISEILVKKTKVRRQIFDDTLETKRKRENYTIRKEEEDRLEAPNAVKSGDPSQVLPLIQSSGRSFFGRIISTLGYLAAGWVLRNLPTWVALGREFIVRVEKAGNIIKNFVSNTINVFTSTYQVLDGFRKNIMTFDLFDDSNRVKNSFDELKTSIDNMGIELENAIKLVTTPLTQTTADGTQVGTYSGADVPALGSTSQDNGAYAGQETSGGKVSSQAVYSYLKSKGMSHNHALGITANILGESGFQMGAQEKGDSQSGVGLFQYSNVRKPAFLKAVPDYKTNWKGQIDYAINEDRAPEYLKTQFSSPEEAAYWWMNKWERPAARVYTGRNKKHNDFIKSFKSGTSPQAPKSTGSPVVVPQQSALPKLPQTGTGGKELSSAQQYGASRNGGARKHAGQDFDAGPNDTFYSRIGGQVKFIGYEPGGYFNYVDIYNQQLNVTERIAEGDIILVKQGQNINPGTPVAKGTKSTGVFHYEIRKGSSRTYGFEGTVNPINFLQSAKVPSSNVQSSAALAQVSAAPTSANPSTPAPSSYPAQISPTFAQQNQQQVAQQITPERRGQDVVAIIPQQQAAGSPQSAAPASSAGGGSSAPSMFDVLNTFMKQKLLLDLAYV
jgi:ribosomal protein L27